MSSDDVASRLLEAIDEAEIPGLTVGPHEPETDMRSGGSWFEVKDRHGVDYVVLVTRADGSDQIMT